MSEKIKYVSDQADLQHWINCYADISRCAGDRIIHRGYCCLHCGSANPSEDCDAPKPNKATGAQQ